MYSLDDEAIREFQALHRKYFGYDITRIQAEFEAQALTSLVESIQPRTQDFSSAHAEVDAVLH